MKRFLYCLFFMAVTRAAISQLPTAAATRRVQPVYTDSSYVQDYSIKYDWAGTGSDRLMKIVCDRNNVVQILSSRGLLRPSGGAFLYPGELAPDKTYRPLSTMTLKAVIVCQRQFIYASEKAILSNAWAGKLYMPHNLPGITGIAAGPDFSFLLTDGHSLQYRKDSLLLWQDRLADSIIGLRWSGKDRGCLILGRQTLSLFSPATNQIRILYRGKDLTCMEPVENSNLLLLGTRDGYLMVDGASGLPIGEPFRRLPCPDITVIRRIHGKTWFGSTHGAFVLRDDSRFDFFASKRWLPSDNVTDITAGPGNTVLILTDRGLGELHFDPMTLYDKAMFFEKQVRDRHIRLGFNSSLERMKEGDLATGSVQDSDNDGLWTSMYLGAEAFRYAATHSPEALQNCRESLDAMERLYTVNSQHGFPSRSFERRGYAAADTQVWKHAANPQWDWKSTTSSDEAIGHVFVFSVIAELVEDSALKNKAIRLLDTLMSHIVQHDLYLVDWNGQPTTWGKWNPEYVNARPVIVGDRKLNSSNIIGMLQTAWHFTGKEKYRDKALELLYKYGYLDNIMRPLSSIGSAPPDADDLSRRLSENWNHSDDEMYFLGYWGMYRYALDDTLREKFKSAILDHWQAERPEKEGAWDMFTAVTGTPQFDLDAAVWYLQRSPMDMINWTIHNSQRQDILPVAPNFRRQTITEVLPPDELPVRRHNANRFDLDGKGHGAAEESAGDIWLLPYWMGRWLQVISAPVKPAGTERAAAAASDTATAGRYIQDYSVKYYPAANTRGALHSPVSAGNFYNVVADRNGVIQVLTDSGVLRPHAGRLLYPGTLQRDRVYRVLEEKNITAMGLADNQFVYLDKEALFSNAWAGRLFVRHGMPDAHLLAVGRDRQFLLSDGRRLALADGDQLAPAADTIRWSGASPVTLTAIRYQPGQNLFFLVSDHSVSAFSPVTKKITPVFSTPGITCLAFHGKDLLVGTHDGYIEVSPAGRPLGGFQRKLPGNDLTALESIDGHLWFGSTDGAFMKRDDSGFNYYVSARWLPGDRVTAIAKGPDSSILILTGKGLGRIVFEPMTLEQKAAFYEDIVRRRHIRYGFYSDYAGVRNGDVSTAENGPHDSDNLWTSMYLVGEMFRYLVTHDAEANANYHESFDAMERLFTLSGITGLFGRCIERRGIVEFKEEYRKNIENYWYPGYARTPGSWHHSPDSAWDWRGSASSDQADGQYFALTLVAQYSDDPALKQRAILLIDQLTGYIVDNGLRLIDIDGRPTLWGLWGPEYVNRFPDRVGDKKLYSSNIISYLQIAWHFTGKEKYRDKALELLSKDHYLQNLTRPVREIGAAPDSADAWSKELSGGWNNSDDEMYFLLYWGLYPYALNDSLKGQYGKAIKDHWEFKRSAKDGLWNLIYGILTGAAGKNLTGAAGMDLAQTLWELQRMPVDLISWPVHNSQRKDLVFLPANHLEQWTRDVLPADERPQNKHNRNLFELDSKDGGGSELGAGDVFLLPYWMGRYFNAIPADHR